jgi:hypothetical protein
MDKKHVKLVALGLVVVAVSYYFYQRQQQAQNPSPAQQYGGDVLGEVGGLAALVPGGETVFTAVYNWWEGNN